MNLTKITMPLYGSFTIAAIIEAIETTTNAKAVSVSLDNDIVSITFQEPEPEPEPEPVNDRICQFCDRPFTLLQEHKEGVCLDCQQGIYP